jgi:dihydroflavonol-4-reductase
MTTAFVTGCTGLLGSNLTRLLLANGYAVRGLARNPAKAERMFVDLDAETRERFTVIEGDLLDLDAWADALHGVDTLFHTAAYFRESFTLGEHREKLWAVNVDGTRSLFEAADAAGVTRTVHTSSSGVLPHAGPGRTLDESDETPPDYDWTGNDYFESKHACDRAIQDFLATHQMPVAFVLPGWMFGPGDDGPTSAGQLVLDLLDQKLPAVPDVSLCVADVRDVALAHLRTAEVLADAPDRWRGERFIAGGPYTSFRTIVDTVEDVAGVPAPRWTVPIGLMKAVALVQEGWGHLTGTDPTLTRRGVQTLAVNSPVDSSKAKDVLGLRFRKLAKTIRATVKYYRRRAPVEPSRTPETA